MSADTMTGQRYGCHSMFARVERMLLKRPAEAYALRDGQAEDWRALDYLHAPDLEVASREHERFAALLAAQIPDVAYLPADPRAGLDSLYTHDSMMVTQRGAILCNMGKPARQGEPDAVAAALAKLDIPILGRIEPPGKLEAGDVVWLDRRTMAVGQGYRTNAEGIRQLRALLQGSVDEIIPVQLPHDRGPAACLHLMSIVSLVDRDLAVVYSPLVPVMFRELLLERGIQLIEVSPEEYETLGSNVLAIAPRVCVIIEGNPNTAAALERAGATVHTFTGREIGVNGTGGPTCLTRPLWRRD